MSPDRRAPARPFYDRVDTIRKARGWTKTRLCQVIGVSRTTFDAWKTNTRTPLPATVHITAEKLGIDPDEALQLAGISLADWDQRLFEAIVHDDDLRAEVEALPPDLRKVAITETITSYRLIVARLRHGKRDDGDKGTGHGGGRRVGLYPSL